MMLDEMVDDGLMRVLRGGLDEMPNDLTRLHAFLKLAAGLLAEKAVEREPTWEMVSQSAAEIETLHTLQQQVAEKTASMQASTLYGVLTKLMIWEALTNSCIESDEPSIRDQLVASVRSDLESIVHRDRFSTANGR